MPAGSESWVQVAADGVGKRVRNLLLSAFSSGQDVYQQVVSLAKSDGTVIDDLSRSSVTQPISAATLPLPAGAATDAGLVTIATDVALQAKLTDTQPVSVAALPLPAGASTDATLALVAKDATLGIVGSQAGAYTVLDRLSKTATETTLQKVLLAIQAQTAKPLTKATTTLLHRS